MTEEWANELELVHADRQEEQAAVLDLETALAEVTFTAGDQDGVLSVTADARGVVLSVQLLGEQFRTVPATRLSELLTLTIAQAQSGAVDLIVEGGSPETE